MSSPRRCCEVLGLSASGSVASNPTSGGRFVADGRLPLRDLVDEELYQDRLWSEPLVPMNPAFEPGEYSATTTASADSKTPTALRSLVLAFSSWNASWSRNTSARTV